MAKSGKSTPEPAGPIKGVLKVSNSELVIRTADGCEYSLETIAKGGNDGGNAQLTVVVDLSKRALGASKLRAELLGVVGALEEFLGERALGTLDANATCGKKPTAPAKKQKPPKPTKPGKS